MKKFGNSEFAKKPTNFYNLDVIISVGYRVKSQRSVQFRIWATSVLKEYMRKGFAMDDERLKGNTRQRENEEYESRQMDYSTGLPMKYAVRKKA